MGGIYSKLERRPIMSFQNKVVIVTGGSNGIGKEVAKSFAKEQATVVIADIDEGNGLRVVSSIQRDGDI